MPWDGTPPPASDNVWIGGLPGEFDKQKLEEIFSQYGTVVDCRHIPAKYPGQNSQGMVRFGTLDEAKWVVESLNGNIAEGLDDNPIQVRFANAAGAGGGGGWSDGGKGDKSSGKAGGKSGGGKADRSQPYGKSGGGNDWGKGGGKDWGKGGGEKGKGEAPSSFHLLAKGITKGGLLPKQHVPEECQVYVKNLPTDTTDLDLYKLFSQLGAIAPTGVKAMTNPDGTCKGFGFVDYLEADSASTACTLLNGFVAPDGGTITVQQKKPSLSKGKGKGKHDDE